MNVFTIIVIVITCVLMVYSVCTFGYGFVKRMIAKRQQKKLEESIKNNEK